MPSTNKTKVTVAKEASSGQFATPAYVLPIRGVADLDTVANKSEDPVITGRNMTSGFFLTSKAAGGNVPITTRPTPAFLLMLYSLLGADISAIQIGAAIRLRYNGASASCKVVANTSGDTLAASIGAKGSESGDTNFGTAGSISLADAGTDTVGELVSTIDAYDDYECEKVFGEDDVDAGLIISVAASQGKDHWVYLFFTSADSGVYLYSLPVDLTDTERPTLTLQVDGREKSEAYVGSVVNSLGISAALQAMAESDGGMLSLHEIGPKSLSATITSGDATVTGVDTRRLVAGMEVSGTGIPTDTTISSITTVAESGELELSATATATGSNTLTFELPEKSALSLEDVDPLLFHKGSTSLGGSDYSYVSNVAVEMTNNSRESGYGQGSEDRQYHQKGKFQATGSLQLRLDEDTYEHREQVFNGQNAAICFEFKGKTIADSIPEMVIVDMPSCELKTFTRPENEGVYDASIEFEAVNPLGSPYDDPVTIHMIMSTEVS